MGRPTRRLRKDERWVEFGTCMRSAGLSIEVLVEYVALFQQGDATIDARKVLPVEQRRILAEKKALIEKTIERYENVLLGKSDTAPA